LFGVQLIDYFLPKKQMRSEMRVGNGEGDENFMSRRRLAKIVLAAAATVAVGQDAFASTDSHSGDKILKAVERLRQGGCLLIFRHERTDVMKLDEEPFALGTCSTQRNLSNAGIASAQQTGTYIQHLKVPIGQVYASPMCRCLDTGRFMFGKVTSASELMGNWRDKSRTGKQAASELQQFAQSVVKPKTNQVLVGHHGPILRAYGVNLSEGETAVVTPAADGKLSVIATIDAHRWGDIIRDLAM
jgi:broad specificity phosphatase PhoE